MLKLSKHCWIFCIVFVEFLPFLQNLDMNILVFRFRFKVYLTMLREKHLIDDSLKIASFCVMSHII